MSAPCDDAQWRAYIRTVDEMQAQLDPRLRPMLIQVLRRGIQVPSPIIHHELALLRQQVRADAINAVVVEDATIRLVQTALDWLHRPHYSSSNHPDFAAALSHVEKLLGRRVPALIRLYSQVSGKA